MHYYNGFPDEKGEHREVQSVSKLHSLLEEEWGFEVPGHQAKAWSLQCGEPWPLGGSIRTLGIKLSWGGGGWKAWEGGAGITRGQVNPRTGDWGALKKTWQGSKFGPGGADVLVFCLSSSTMGSVLVSLRAWDWHEADRHRAQFQPFSVGMNLGKLFSLSRPWFSHLEKGTLVSSSYCFCKSYRLCFKHPAQGKCQWVAAPPLLNWWAVWIQWEGHRQQEIDPRGEGESSLMRFVVLKHDYAPESSVGLRRPPCHLGATLVSDPVGLGQGPRTVISNKFLGNAGAVGLGATLGNPLHKVTYNGCSLTNTDSCPDPWDGHRHNILSLPESEVKQRSRALAQLLLSFCGFPNHWEAVLVSRGQKCLLYLLSAMPVPGPA